MAAQNRFHRPWTHEQWICLHILWEEHSLSTDDRTNFFNKIFKNILAISGIDVASRTTQALSVERSKRLHHGSCSWEAWQAVCSIADDGQEQSMVERMRRSVDGLLRADIEPVTPPRSVPSAHKTQPVTTPRSTSSNVSTQPTALLFDAGRFARFTESVARKRKIAALCTPPSTTDGEHAYSFEDTPGPKRPRHTLRDQSPAVVVPKASDTQTLHGIVHVEEPESLTTAKASIQRSKTTKYATATEPTLPLVESHSQLQHDDQHTPIAYPRMGNIPLLLSPSAHTKAPPHSLPYNDVSEEAAHPPLPSLLWRYYDSSSQGLNSPSGFKSGRSAHARAPLRGPPPCKDLEWIDILEHHNPSKNSELRIHSPFISTSSRLLWLLRKALGKGGPTRCISLIDSSGLDPKGVYYLPPFHTELKKHLVFDNGAQYYKGISEHLVWNEIPPPAIIKTVSLAAFCAFVDSNTAVKCLLRLDKLDSSAKLDEISRTLKHDSVKLTDNIATAIAELALFFGLDHTSPEQYLSRFVYEIAQGWALTAESAAHSSWQAKAQAFTHALCRRSDEPVPFVEQSRIYYAFLNGLKHSCGDVNVHLKGPEALAMMQKRAAKVGLESPSNMIISELEAAIVTTRFSARRGSSSIQEDNEPGQIDQPLSNLAQIVRSPRESARSAASEDGDGIVYE